MAMTKKEQAEMESLRRELAIAKAFRFTDEINPDVPPPARGTASFGEITKGWLFNEYNDVVDIACSSSISHAWGRDDKTTSQGPRSLYSTRTLALMALRAKVECIVAARLADIDKQIADAKGV